MKKTLTIVGLVILVGVVALLTLSNSQVGTVHIGEQYRDGFGNIITVRDIGTGEEISKRYTGDINLMLGPRDSIYVVFVDPSSQTLAKVNIRRFLWEHALVK